LDFYNLFTKTAYFVNSFCIDLVTYLASNIHQKGYWELNTLTIATIKTPLPYILPDPPHKVHVQCLWGRFEAF